MLVAHEVGHAVHQRLLPDGDGEGWATFRRLRGIEDGSVYNATAVHKNRPHEIFAEDFRVLFGGPDALSGGVENRDLVPPEQVDGLRAFFLLLAEPGPKPWQRRNLVLAPNPTAGGVRVGFADPFATTGLGPWVLSVYDVRGRLVARTAAAAAGELQWDGRTDRDELARPGVYFVRAARGLETWSGKLLVAR
jgi:hypothetical protein